MWKLLTAAATVTAFAIHSWWPGASHKENPIKIPPSPKQEVLEHDALPGKEKIVNVGGFGNQNLHPHEIKNIEISGKDEPDGQSKLQSYPGTDAKQPGLGQTVGTQIFNSKDPEQEKSKEVERTENKKIDRDRPNDAGTQNKKELPDNEISSGELKQNLGGAGLVESPDAKQPELSGSNNAKPTDTKQSQLVNEGIPAQDRIEFEQPVVNHVGQKMEQVRLAENHTPGIVERPVNNLADRIMEPSVLSEQRESPQLSTSGIMASLKQKEPHLETESNANDPHTRISDRVTTDHSSLPPPTKKPEQPMLTSPSLTSPQTSQSQQGILGDIKPSPQHLESSEYIKNPVIKNSDQGMISDYSGLATNQMSEQGTTSREKSVQTDEGHALIPERTQPEQHVGDEKKVGRKEVEEEKIEDGELDQLNIHKGAIVHLFEWKWSDIAIECEKFLEPNGFEAIQISPPTENMIVPGRPWWERYQPVSYKLESRSGTRAQLKDMLKRCNKVGIKVFADVVFNHMTSDTKYCKGVAGSTCNPEKRDYPEIPYTWDDFHHPRCDIRNMQNATEVRVCEMFYLHDLNQSRPNVQDKIVDLMNDLIDIGVAGFRINAAKNMYAGHLYQIYSRLKNLNIAFGLPKRTKPMIFQDVHDMGNEAVKYEEYVPLALITDVRYGHKMSEYFKHRQTALRWLQHLDKDSFLTPDMLSLVFVDNHNTERDGKNINYKQSRAYKMAIAFMLAYGYGYPFVLSGFKFENFDQGPPSDNNGNLISPEPNPETNLCHEKWVCQHRWRQVYTMVQFNRASHGAPVTSWWDNGNSQIAFSRGNKGFVAFNLENNALDATIKTDLPPGKYCDVISGVQVNGKCEGGNEVEVVRRGDSRDVKIYIKPYNEHDYGSDGIFAIFDHKISRLA